MEYFTASLLLIAAVLFAVILRRRPSLAAAALKSLPLPPGSLGWPYIGETFQLYSQNPNHFFSSKLAKYGAIFKKV